MRVLERFVEKPRECSYLPDRKASLEVLLALEVGADELEELLVRGWRRFGPCYFRPACATCSECVSLRVPVATFHPSKTQRRVVRAVERRFRREVGVPSASADRIALHQKWHAQREETRGWNENPVDAERYAFDFAFPHPAAREAAYYDEDGHLAAVGLFDQTPHALSAAYFFYDPDLAHLSLGVANVLHLVDDARRLGVPHVYLGYRVAGCASLAYKSGYRPHELMRERPAPTEVPPWRSAEDAGPAATAEAGPGHPPRR
jgi:arginine-tRNA-protein transferase